MRKKSILVLGLFTLSCAQAPFSPTPTSFSTKADTITVTDSQIASQYLGLTGAIAAGRSSICVVPAIPAFDYAQWSPYTQYAPGSRWTANGNDYEVVSFAGAGYSAPPPATGPSGTDSNIPDGDLTWNYLAPTKGGGRIVASELFPAVVDPQSGLQLAPGECPQNAVYARLYVGNLLEAIVGATDDDVSVQMTVPAVRDVDANNWVSIDVTPNGDGRYPVIAGHHYEVLTDFLNNAAYFPRPSGVPARDVVSGHFRYTISVAYFVQ